jgi:hypothetical protein
MLQFAGGAQHARGRKSLPLWSGGELEELEASASGWRAKLREPLTRTHRVLAALEQRVSDQMTTVNQRLYELEKAVFKDNESGTDEQE